MTNPKWSHLMNGSETNKWQGFDKNPQNINRKGRPRKWISLVNKQLKELWYEPATKQDIEENYLQILQLNSEELAKMLNDKDQPILVKVIIQNIMSEKGFDVIEKMLDRWIWKAVQKTENREVMEDWKDRLDISSKWGY